MGIVIPDQQLVKPEEVQKGIKLGEIEKANPFWIAALGFDDLPTGDVDGDLWTVGCGPDGQAIDLVFYDPNDPTREVESMMGTGAFRYLGDARSGSKIKGDDEQTIIDHVACHRAGIVRNWLIGHVYDPPGIDWSKVPNSYLRIFPQGVSDREGNILKPDKADAIKAVKLDEIGRGANCIVFGYDEFVGPGPFDWVFKPTPTKMPSLREGLAKLGVELPDSYMR